MRETGNYQTCPPNLADSAFAHSITAMNVMVSSRGAATDDVEADNRQAAMTVNSRVIKTFLSWNPDATDMPLSNGQRVQVLPEMEDLVRARKHQFAAFVASQGLLVVWDDEPTHLIERARMLEAEMIDMIWHAGDRPEAGEKKAAEVAVVEIDEESGQIVAQDRPTHLQNSVLVAFTLIIVVVLLGLGFRAVAGEIAVDHKYTRVAFLALTPGKLLSFTCPRVHG
jgi:hypothetical protein